MSFSRNDGFPSASAVNFSTPSAPSSSAGSTLAAASTAPVVSTSLRLSAAAAASVVEPTVRPTLRFISAIHSFTAMEITSTVTAAPEKATSSGCRMLPTEVRTSSKPMTTIIAATARPDRYSNRAWP